MIEEIAYHNWVMSLNKNGFPKNSNGTSMDCWQLYEYYSCLEENGICVRQTYINHATKDHKQMSEIRTIPINSPCKCGQ